MSKEFKTTSSLENTAMVLCVSYKVLKFKIKQIQNKLKHMRCKTTYSNLSLTYACVIVSAFDVSIINTWTPCLYLKNDVAHDLSISKNTQ